MPATRELLTSELRSIESKITASSAQRLGEGADLGQLLRRRDEIVSLLEQLQPNDAMRDPRILRG